MDLALILEFGSRLRLLALGRISALLPSRDNDLVRLNLEAMGVIDFDDGTAAIDAVLVDSRLAHKFPITGSRGAARRLWRRARASSSRSAASTRASRRRPTVPQLERVTIALSSGNNPRLICEAYFAITSNTVQFGARAALYASAAGFSVEGDVGFDVLVQLMPLHFIADFQARLQLKRGSHNLFMVKLKGSLEGPRPLRVSGKATFEILWCDFSVRFDTTLVKGERPPLPPAVDVLAQLTQALDVADELEHERSATQTHGVALRSLPAAGPGAPIVLDPLGQLRVSQQVVPLNTRARHRSLRRRAGGRRAALCRHRDDGHHAAAAHTAQGAIRAGAVLRDERRREAGGAVVRDDGVRERCLAKRASMFDATQVIPAPLEYEHIPITLDGTPPVVPSDAAPAPQTLTPTLLQTFARSGAAGRAPVRHVGRARFRNDAVTGAATLTPPRWAIAPTAETQATLTVDPEVSTWSEYQGVLKTANRARARWQIVPAS